MSLICEYSRDKELLKTLSERNGDDTGLSKNYSAKPSHSA